jgi:hypothetical protein
VKTTDNPSFHCHTTTFLHHPYFILSILLSPLISINPHGDISFFFVKEEQKQGRAEAIHQFQIHWKNRTKSARMGQSVFSSIFPTTYLKDFPYLSSTLSPYQYSSVHPVAPPPSSSSHSRTQKIIIILLPAEVFCTSC